MKIERMCDMICTNIPKLRGVLKEKGITQRDLAKKLEMNESTVSRKFKHYGYDFTIGEVKKIAQVLDMSHKDAIEIFLSDDSHKCEIH